MNEVNREGGGFPVKTGLHEGSITIYDPDEGQYSLYPKPPIPESEAAPERLRRTDRENPPVTDHS